MVNVKVNIRVFVNNISAERFWEISKPIPQVKITTNLNVVGIEKKGNQTLEVPFIFNISYMPAVAQINIKGRAVVTGEKNELEKIHTAYKEKKPPPPQLIQAISNVVFIESVIISRTVGIPPPIPLPQIPVAPTKKPKEPPYRA